MDSMIFLSSTIACSFYLYFRIRKISIKETGLIKTLVLIVFSVALAYCIYELRSLFPFLRIVFMVAFSSLVAKVVTKIRMKIAIATMLISMGIIYVIHTISLAAAYSLLLSVAFYGNPYLPVILSVLSQVILIIVGLLIAKKRNWLRYFQEEAWMEGPGLLLSVLIIVAGTVIGKGETTETIWLIIAIPVLAGGFVASGIAGTKRYMEQKRLEAANEKRSRLIHDYEYSIPVAFRVIKDFSMEMSTEISGDLKSRLAAAESILGSLSQEISERSLANRTEFKDIPKTGVPLVDEGLQRMAKLMKDGNVQFGVNVNNSMECLLSDNLIAAKLSGLINNLVNNARYAVSKSKSKQVKVIAGFSVSVNDKMHKSGG